MSSFYSQNEAFAAKDLIDDNVIAALPKSCTVFDVLGTEESAWSNKLRIYVRLPDGTEQSYHLKTAFGDHGLASMRGDFEASKAIRAVTPDFIPEPIAWGTFKSRPDHHFCLAVFHQMVDELPDIEPFCAKLAELHKNGVAEHGKFGFPVTTYNGDLPQDNAFGDLWEEFFSRGFRHMLSIRTERAGPSQKLDEISPKLFDIVIPRLLRPLETGENPIKPVLVHGDLWCGNSAVDIATGRPLVFDPAAFYAHNEYELGNWRPERNRFSKAYFNAYHSHIPKAFPEEDYDDRNALYAMRFNLHAAALFPTIPTYLDSVIAEMQRLTKKYSTELEI